MATNNIQRDRKKVKDEHDYTQSSVHVDRPESLRHEPLSQFLQQGFLVLLTYYDEEAMVIRDTIDTDLYTDPYRPIAVQIYAYIDQQKTTPKDHLMELFEDTLLNRKDEKQQRRAEELENILQEIHANRDRVRPQWLVDRVWLFVRHQNIKKATIHVAENVFEQGIISEETVLEAERWFEEVLEKNARTRPELGRLASGITPESTEWLWYPYLPAEELTLLGGRKGRRKGNMLTSLAAIFSNGRMWPDRSDKAPRNGRVLWVEAEDSIEKTIIPRLQANGAKLENVTCMTEDEFLALSNLKRYIEKHKIRLIVFSPLVSFLPKLRNANDEIGVRKALGRLHSAVKGNRCAMIGIVHLNKKPDLDALERVLGSQAFTAYVRCVLLLEFDEEWDGWSRMVHAAHNLSTKGNDMLLETQHVGTDPRDQWVKVRWETTKDDVDLSKLFDRKTPKKGSAVEWLIKYLEVNGETHRADVLKAGKAAGYQVDALKQARKRNADRIGWSRDEFQGKTTWYLK